MLIKRFGDGDAKPRTWMIVLAPGDEAKESLLRFARDQHVASASFFALGAFERAVVGYFQWDEKTYKPIPITQQVEVLSLIGDIVPDESGPHVLHAHTVLGLSDGTTRGGHLLEGHVRPTLEITVTETPAHLVRRMRSDLGVALIDFG